MHTLTLGDSLLQAESRLSEGPHPDRARKDAENLLCHLLRKNRAWLLTHRDAGLDGPELEEFNQLVERRRAGEPVQYIAGEVEFYRMPFRVNRDVLIPRPETEHVVECASQLIPAFGQRSKGLFEFRRIHPATHSEKQRERRGDPQQAGWPPRVLDVGAGSGCIAIGIAHDWSEAEITAIDSSTSALEVARFNAERLGFAGRIRFLEGDLLAPVAGERFEIVVSNPPYVPEKDRGTLAVEVRDYEPQQALFAGEDGLAVYRRLIPEAFGALVPGGFVVLEIGFGQRAAIRALLAQSGFEEIGFTADLQGIPRVASARRPAAAG
ncbi:MAG: peptide chain release factor N(5)-glutamine methyltransferase [Terracidiphilus sp.]